MQGSTSGGSWAGAIFALSVALALPASVEAKGVVIDTLDYHWQTKQIGQGADSLSAECVDVDRLHLRYPISGGFEADLELDDQLNIDLSRDFTSDVPVTRGWGVSYGAPYEIYETITVRAICAEERPKYVENTRPRSALPSGKQGSVSVRCPPGRHVYGGGGGVPDRYGDSSLAASFPIDSNDRNTKPDDGWKVSVDNRDGFSQPLIVRAACGKTMPSYRETPVSVNPFSGATVNVGCGVPPNSPLAIGGGHKIGGGPNEGRLAASIVTNPTDFTVYKAAMYNVSEDALPFTAYAICGDPSDFG